jgi:hypothetical protein
MLEQLGFLCKISCHFSLKGHYHQQIYVIHCFGDSVPLRSDYSTKKNGVLEIVVSKECMNRLMRNLGMIWNFRLNFWMKKVRRNVLAVYPTTQFRDLNSRTFEFE